MKHNEKSLVFQVCLVAGDGQRTFECLHISFLGDGVCLASAETGNSLRDTHCKGHEWNINRPWPDCFFVGFFSTRTEESARNNSLSPDCYALIQMHMNSASFSLSAFSSGSLCFSFERSSSLSLWHCSSFSLTVS